MESIEVNASKTDKRPRVMLTLTPDEADSLNRLAEYEGRSKAGYLRWLLLREMRSHEIFQGQGSR